MISVEEALERIFGLITPLGTEEVPLRNAANRVLAAPVAATLDQPPFSASIMDGYAICDHGVPGDRFHVIGESAAGQRFEGKLNTGQAVRIFTGAPVPPDAIRVVIQEDVNVFDDHITLKTGANTTPFIRPMGADFKVGDAIAPPRVITPADVALIASMNVAKISVSRRPDVAIIATGNELVQPGEVPLPDQIVASNGYGLAAILERVGALPRLLPIARDNPESHHSAFDLAQGADLVITIGGASVGDHDLVANIAEERGADMALHRVAMRPGKPLMAGILDGAAMIGLPGNPVSSMVCGHIFIVPAVRKLLGLPAAPMPRRKALLTQPLSQNGPREHYMRAHSDGETVTPYDRQDSALLSVLANANALVVREPNAKAVTEGCVVEVVDI